MASLKLANNTTCALELLESMLILSMQVIQGTTRKLSAMAINVAEASPCLCSAKNITGSLSPAGGKLAPEQGRHARIGLVCMLSWKTYLSPSPSTFKKLLQYLSHRMFAARAWSIKCRRKEKVIAQFGGKLRDGRFEPN